MARGGRFKTLEYMRRVYKPGKGNAGEPYYEYIEYKEGKKVLTRAKMPTGPREKRMLLPFGEPATGDKVLINMSGRVASVGLSGVGLTETDLALEAAAATASGDKEFIPAKVTIYLDAGTAVNTASQITKKKYDKKAGHSLTVPFGQSTGTRANVKGAQAYIANKINAVAKASFTFTPERFYGS